MNVYTFLQHTDELLLRTRLVRNDTASPSGKRVTTLERICFMRPDDITSELVSHLPPLSIPTVSLVDVVYTDPDLFPQPFWRSPPDTLKSRDYRAALHLWQQEENDREAVVSLLGEGFAPSRPRPTRDVPGVSFNVGDVVTAVTWLESSPPPRGITEGAEAVLLPEISFQIISGLRAVLLTILDTGGVLSKDPDFLGIGPASDIYSAMDIMSKWELKDFVPNVKYWKDYSLAVFLDNPPPKVPSSWPFDHWDPLFSGRLRAYWRRLCHSHNNQPEVSAQFFRANFSIAQSKRGFAPVPPSFIEGAYKTHAKKLATPPAPQEKSTSDDLKTFLNVFFRNFRPRDLIGSLSLREASTSASNTSTRESGGAREELRKEISHHLDTSLDGLVRFVELDQGIVEERGLLPPTRSEWRKLVQAPLDFHYDTLPKAVKNKIPAAWRSFPFSKVVALQEPLKIRIITKMQSLSTFLSGPLQHALWNYLRRFPCFDLTSRTFSTQNMHDLIAREKALFGHRPAPFVSGDYSAATDGLDIQATKLVLDVILSKLVGEDRDLIPHIRAILLEQVLVYPPEADQSPVLQMNGQLMGSVLSFPVLCILNLFTYVQSLPDTIRIQYLSGRRPLKSLPVLVNGDDILFRADPDQYERWLVSSKSVGFTLSLGKNFVHSNFMTVNSIPIVYREIPAPVTEGTTIWTIRPDVGERLSVKNPLSWADTEDLPKWAFQDSYELRTLGYINIGLLLNVATSVDERGRHGLVPLSNWYEWAVVGAMNTQRAHNLFLHYHNDGIKRQTRFGRFSLNIFAHPLLGGLGFTVPEGVTPRFTEPQRHLAHCLYAAANAVYHGPGGDHPLRPFARLTASVSTEMSLGTRGANLSVDTMLEAPIGPLVAGQDPFDSDFTVRATPLAMGYGYPEETFLSASCRLSNNELKRLLKGANHGRKEKLPLEQMTSFPFRLVTYEPEGPETPDVVEPPLIEPHLSPPALVVELDVREIWEIDPPPFTPADLKARYDEIRNRPPLRDHAVRDRLREERRILAVQGLLQDNTPTRSGRFSRKGGNRWRRG